MPKESADADVTRRRDDDGQSRSHSATRMAPVAVGSSDERRMGIRRLDAAIAGVKNLRLVKPRALECALFHESEPRHSTPEGRKALSKAGSPPRPRSRLPLA